MTKGPSRALQLAQTHLLTLVLSRISYFGPACLNGSLLLMTRTGGDTHCDHNKTGTFVVILASIVLNCAETCCLLNLSSDNVLQFYGDFLLLWFLNLFVFGWAESSSLCGPFSSSQAGAPLQLWRAGLAPGWCLLFLSTISRAGLNSCGSWV